MAPALARRSARWQRRRTARRYADFRGDGKSLDAAKLKKLAVLGPLADTPNLGDGGSSNVLQPEVTTPLAGLRSALPGVEIVHGESDADVARDA